MRTLLLISSLLVMTLGISSEAIAQISVDRVYIRFTPDARPVQNVILRNNGKEPAYINVVTDEMINPGEKNEERVPTTKLLVSPKRFSLDPGGQRTVRLLLKEKFGENEQVYRGKSY